MDVLSLAQVTGGLRLRELLTRVGGDRPDLALLQVASEVKAGNVSVSVAGSVGTVLGNGAELRRMSVSDIADQLQKLENQEDVVVDPTERSYRLR
jgi:hypothetical protein